jgi:nucleotide-binding universal stress UspA family protein
MNNDPLCLPIVVGLDGSGESVRAAEWAADLAQRRGAGVHLLHALNLTGAISLLSTMSHDEYCRARAKDAETLLDAVRDELHSRFPRLRITTETAEGTPIEALADASGRAALTVVGTRGRGGFLGLALGSVGLQLAAHSRGPVVLVPAGPGCDAEPADGDIVLGVEEGERPEVVGFAFDLAEELGKGLRAVHAWQTIPAYNGYYYIDPSVLHTAADSMLVATLRDACRVHAKVPVTVHVTCAEPAAALNQAARGARLLVLGAHRSRAPFSVGVGRVLHALLIHAPCPVAVVPATSMG